MVNPALFGSWIGSSTATTITSGDITADIGALMDGTRAHYLEVVEGPTGSDDPLVGQRFEVDVPASVSCTLEGPDQGRQISDWEAMGIRRVSGRPFPDRERSRYAVISNPSRIDTPEEISVPSVLVKRATADFLCMSPRIGRVSMSLSIKSCPPFVA